MSAVELQTIVSGPTFPPLEHIKASSAVPRTATTPFNALCAADFNPIAPRFFGFIPPTTTTSTNQLPPTALTSSPLLQPPTHPAHGSVHPSPVPTAATPSPNLQRQQRPIASPRHQQHLQQRQQQFAQQPPQQAPYQQQPQPQGPPPQPQSALTQSNKRKRSIDDNDDQGRPMTEVKQPYFVRPEDLYTSPPLPLSSTLDFVQTTEPVNMGDFYQGGSPYQTSRAPVLPSQQQVPRRVSAPETEGQRSRQMPSASPGMRFSEPPNHYAAPQGSAYGSYGNPAYSYQGVRAFQQQQQPPQSFSSSVTPSPHTSMPETFPPFARTYPYPQQPLAQMPPPQPSVEQPRQKPRCWEHGCNGREFSTFSNLLRHQREKSGAATKSYCPRCQAVFTRSTAMSNHLQQAKCKPRPGAEH